jgi:hypothetical protein
VAPEKVTGLEILKKAGVKVPEQRDFFEASEIDSIRANRSWEQALEHGEGGIREAIARSAHPMEGKLPPGALESHKIDNWEGKRLNRQWQPPSLQQLYQKMVEQARPEVNLGVARALRGNPALAKTYRPEDMGVLIHELVLGDPYNAFPTESGLWLVYPSRLEWPTVLLDPESGYGRHLPNGIHGKAESNEFENPTYARHLTSRLQKAAAAFQTPPAFEMIHSAEGLVFVQAKSVQKVRLPFEKIQLTPEEQERMVCQQARCPLETAHPFARKESLPTLVWNTTRAAKDEDYRRAAWKFALEQDAYFFVDNNAEIPAPWAADEKWTRTLALRRQLMQYSAGSLSGLYGPKREASHRLDHGDMPHQDKQGAIGILHREAPPRYPGDIHPESCLRPFWGRNAIQTGEIITVFTGFKPAEEEEEGEEEENRICGFILSEEQMQRVYGQSRLG